MRQICDIGIFKASKGSDMLIGYCKISNGSNLATMNVTIIQ